MCKFVNLNKGILFFLFSLVLLIVPAFLRAMTLEITQHPTELQADEPFDIKLKIQGATGNASWLRAVFVSREYDKGYFGYIRSNQSDTWGNSANDTNSLYFIDTSEYKDWEGTISAKVDLESKHYTGPGTYKFRIGRYTQSGSNTAWSNEVDIFVAYQKPAPPTPEAIPETGVYTDKIDQNKSTPTPKPSVSLTSTKPTPSPVTNITKDQVSAGQSKILGDAVSQSTTAAAFLKLPDVKLEFEEVIAESANNASSNDSKNNSKSGYYFISSGLVYLAGAGIRILRG